MSSKVSLDKLSCPVCPSSRCANPTLMSSTTLIESLPTCKPKEALEDAQIALVCIVDGSELRVFTFQFCLLAMDNVNFQKDPDRFP